MGNQKKSLKYLLFARQLNEEKNILNALFILEENISYSLKHYFANKILLTLFFCFLADVFLFFDLRLC